MLVNQFLLKIVMLKRILALLLIMHMTYIPVKASDAYYVEVVNGCITDNSIKSICETVGKQYDILPELLHAIVWKESRYVVNAENNGAKGLCQIMTKWHSGRMDELGIDDIYDPYNNILLCADIISNLREHEYGSDVSFALMAYNMGVNKAEELYDSCIVSNYAMEVLEKSYELEHDKE